MPKNLIFNSLKESFALIWKNKLLFVLLFVLQIIFFVSFSSISYTYITKIIESEKAIEDYIAKLSLDEASVTASMMEKKSVLGDDPLSISRNFKEILKNFKLYLIYTFLLLIFFASFNWTITNKIVYKINFKQLLRNFLNSLIILLFYLGIIFTFFYTILNISLMEIADSTKLVAKYGIFLMLSIVLIYFMFISISLSYKTELKNIVQRTLSVGIKKIHYILAIYFINIFLFIVSIFLLYYFVEKNMFMLLLSLILMVFSFVFGRIFIVNVVEKLEA